MLRSSEVRSNSYAYIHFWLQTNLLGPLWLVQLLMALCIAILEVLMQHGKLSYEAQNFDPVDEEWILSNMDGLKNLFSHIPGGNGKYSMFVKAILQLMRTPQADGSESYANAPTTTKVQLKEAEEQATILRTVCFHIRREWYRKSHKTWMANFPRPDPPICVLPAPQQGLAAPTARRER